MNWRNARPVVLRGLIIMGEWKSVGKLTKTNRSMLNLFSYGSDDSDSGIEEVYLVGKLVDV